MVGEEKDVRVHALASEAAYVERALSEQGLCNWLVDWSDSTGEHVYCGQPAETYWEPLCSVHRQYGVYTGGGE